MVVRSIVSRVVRPSVRSTIGSDGGASGGGGGGEIATGGTITEVSGQTLTVAHEISQATTNVELVITFKLGPIGTVGSHSIVVTLFWGGNTQTVGTFNNASYGSTEQTIHFFPAILPALVPASGVQMASLRIAETIASPRTGAAGTL